MKPRRTLPERVTLLVSLVILAAVVGLVARQLPGDDAPPAPVVAVEEVRRVGDLFHVVATITNEGDQTAADTQVRAELDLDGARTEGDQTIDFLAGGERRTVVFVFDGDPGGGELVVSISGYTVP